MKIIFKFHDKEDQEENISSNDEFLLCSAKHIAASNAYVVDDNANIIIKLIRTTSGHTVWGGWIVRDWLSEDISIYDYKGAR